MTFRRLTDLLYPVLTTYERAIAILPSAERLSLLVYCSYSHCMLLKYFPQCFTKYPPKRKMLQPKLCSVIKSASRCAQISFMMRRFSENIKNFQSLRSWVESLQVSLSYQRRCNGLIPHTRKRLQERSTRLTTNSRIRYSRYRIHTVTKL